MRETPPKKMIKLNDKILISVISYKYLGVTVDEKLNFGQEFNQEY